MKIHVIDTGFFKLDGGAMFGVVPKVIWQKMEQPDENNLCTWAMRCLLIEDGDRRILVDTGIGNKQSEKFFSNYHLHGEHSLVRSLASAGFGVDDITDVLLTHFHFDHAGGAVSSRKNMDGSLVFEPTFPNAKYWTNQAHYDWAASPNPRESASFLKENFEPLRDVLQYVPSLPHYELLQWQPNISLQYAYGHTEAMMLPHIKVGDKTIVFCADLLPSPSHLGLPYVMGYDVRPLQTMTEKDWFLQKAANEQFILFFEHAPHIEACTVKANDKGKIIVDTQGQLSALLAGGI